MLQRLLYTSIFGLLTMPATAAPVVFYTGMSGPQESPPNASLGTGFASVTIDVVAHTMTVYADFTGLDGLTTAAHIHVINGPGDANTADTLGPVATQTPSFLLFPLGVTQGQFTQTLDLTALGSYRAGFVTDSGGTAATAEAALYAGIAEGRAYFNVHSSVFGGGEIRGFLTPAPEPGTIGMFAAAVGALLLWRRKRQQTSRAFPSQDQPSGQTAVCSQGPNSSVV